MKLYNCTPASKAILLSFIYGAKIGIISECQVFSADIFAFLCGSKTKLFSKVKMTFKKTSGNLFRRNFAP